MRSSTFHKFNRLEPMPAREHARAPTRECISAQVALHQQLLLQVHATTPRATANNRDNTAALKLKLFM